jgi:hypothetical protein
MVSLPEITPLMSGLACRIFVDHVVIALRADAGVGVGFLADQLDIIALLAHQLDELLRAELGALVVVRHDLRGGNAGGVDLAIDQEGRHTGILGLLHRRDSRVSAGVVEDNGLGAASDRGVDEFGLLVGVVVVHKHQRLVAEFFRLGLGANRLGLEEGIVVRRRDDGDQVGGEGRSRRAEGEYAGHRGKRQSASKFHA